LQLRPGDGLLLCSDGLWGMVYPTDHLTALVAAGGDPPAICRRLIDAANEAGGEDNVTVIWTCLVGDDG
jgi:protein phosphatase